MGEEPLNISFSANDDLELVNTNIEGNQYLPDLSYSAFGTTLITWSSEAQDGDGYGIFGQFYGKGGQKVGSEFQINSTVANDQLFSDSVSLANGEWIVVWRTEQNTLNVFGQRLSSSGNKLGPEFQLNETGGAADTKIATQSDGSWIAVWYNEISSGIIGRKFSPDGSPLSSEFLISTNNSFTPSYPDITILNNGSLVVVWETPKYNSSDKLHMSISAQVLTSDGSLINGEFDVFSDETINYVNATITALDDGGYIVAGTSNGGIIRLQRFSSDGVRQGDELIANDEETIGSNPKLISAEHGGWYIIWGNYIKEYGADGNVLNETLISTAKTPTGYIDGVLIDDTISLTWSADEDIYKSDISFSANDDDLYIVDNQNFWNLWASGDVIDGGMGTDHLYLAPNTPIESLPDAAITNMGVGLEYFEFDLNLGKINAVPTMLGTMAVTEGTYPVEGADIKAPTFLGFEDFSYYGNADAKIADTADDNVLITGGGEDVIFSIGGRDLISSYEQSDEIILSSSKIYASNIVAHNISADWQIGTNARVSVSGKTQFETVVNGGEGYDVVTLTDKSDAYFLHDNHSAFNADIILSEDFRGRDGFNRISLIEEIDAGDGNDVIDLTSPDYSLAGQTLLVDAGNGQDVVWGSDADETLIGGADNDVLFGGAGINELFGGSGADEFQFTRTSENDTVSDFSIAGGDTLKFFNTGGALFDRDSLSLNAAGDKLSIAYGDDISDILTITLSEAGLTLDDLAYDVVFIM